MKLSALWTTSLSDNPKQKHKKPLLLRTKTSGPCERLMIQHEEINRILKILKEQSIH